LSSFATLLAPTVQASQAYPAELLEYYGVGRLPAPGLGCTLCHGSDAGGNRTVVTPYGRALMTSFNAAGNNVPSLLAALNDAEAAGWDSDRDGVSDAAELRAGADPNSYDGDGQPPALNDVPLPQTGCSLASSAVASGAWSAVIAALAAAIAARRCSVRRKP
jgi:hypothetical protein